MNLSIRVVSTMNLSQDALTEILLRLPVKSLVRFRCVSKTWLALLRSPRFIHMHLKFSLARDDEHVLIKRFVREESKNVLSFHSNDESLKVVAPNLEVTGFSHHFLPIVGCSNGIICLSDYDDFILCNPATRELSTIPPRPFGCPEGFYCKTAGVGFGFDPTANDYKVVRIVRFDTLIFHDPNYDYDYENDPHRAEIYHLSTNTWKQLDAVLPPIDPPGSGLLFNGCLHWFASDGGYECPKGWILSLNISTDMFQKFEFPEPYDPIEGGRQSLFVIDECLACIRHTHIYPSEPTYDQFINVWVMTEYGVKESWTRRYSIGPLRGIEYPLSTWKNDWLLLERAHGEINRRGNIAGADGQLVACNLLNGELRTYDVYGFQHSLGVVFYKESLVPITRN